LVGAHGDEGRFGKSQLSFGIGSSQKILESLLSEQRFLRKWLGPHKCVIVRTKGCTSGARIQGAGSASQANQRDKKEGLFQRAEFQLDQAARF
jgi:hypothetical protein